MRGAWVKCDAVLSTYVSDCLLGRRCAGMHERVSEYEQLC